MARPVVERSFWLDSVGPASTAAAAEVPTHVDVAVIGGGFTGLSAALALAKRGGSVAVLEEHSAGWGASSRNGGMALTGLKLPAEALLAKLGPAKARSLYDSSLAAIAFVESIVREGSIDCDFARTGHLEVACKRGHFDAFRRSAEVLARHFDRRVRVVEKSELGLELASDVYHGGLVDELSAGLNPHKFALGLRREAVRAGAVIAEEARVERIERADRSGSPGFRVTTARGTLWAGEVLVATGAYTGVATPALRRRVVPVGSYVIATEALDETSAKQLIPHSRMVFDSNNFLYYYRLTPERRLLFGGRAAFFPANERTVRDSAAILRRGMLGVFPQLRDVSIEYAWGGAIDFTFDMLPHAGVLDGIYFALGYAGHGVAMATYTGARMAALIAGEANDALCSGPLPAAPLGLYDGTPWFLPIAGAWYKLMDWAS